MVNRSHAYTCHNNNNIVIITCFFIIINYLVLFGKTISKGISSDHK